MNVPFRFFLCVFFGKIIFKNISYTLFFLLYIIEVVHVVRILDDPVVVIDDEVQVHVHHHLVVSFFSLIKIMLNFIFFLKIIVEKNDRKKYRNETNINVVVILHRIQIVHHDPIMGINYYFFLMNLYISKRFYCRKQPSHSPSNERHRSATPNGDHHPDNTDGNRAE